MAAALRTGCVLTVPGTNIWYSEGSDAHFYVAILQIGESFQFLGAVASSAEEASRAISKEGQIVLLKALAEIFEGLTVQANFPGKNHLLN